MRVYIYDSFLNQKKYDRLLAQIETRLTDLDLNGKISRLSIMKNIKEVVADELKRGASTIIAVGNNKIVNQIINSLANFNIPLGIIPIQDENNSIAKSLGINDELTACEILSARRIAKIDLGLANNSYFLSTAMVPSRGTTLEISKNYAIEILEPGKIKIFNLPPADGCLLTKKKVSPQDGTLELMIETGTNAKFFNKPIGRSVFLLKKALIKNAKFPVLLDNTVPLIPPVEFSVVKQKLKLIVGKNRKF